MPVHLVESFENHLNEKRYQEAVKNFPETEKKYAADLAAYQEKMKTADEKAKFRQWNTAGVPETAGAPPTGAGAGQQNAGAGANANAQQQQRPSGHGREETRSVSTHDLNGEAMAVEKAKRGTETVTR